MRTTSLVIALGLFTACGGDDDGGGGGDADAAPDEEADAAPDLGACPGDSQAIAFDDPVEDAIAEPGERDRYLFTGEAGTWMIIDIDANPGNDPELLDSFLRLYGPDGEVLASNDDALPVIDRDSEVVTRLPADGDYCVEVLALSDADGDDDTEPQGDPSHLYTVVMVDVDESDEFATIDPEDGDEPGDAIGTTIGTSNHYILGELDGEDFDAFLFDVPDLSDDTSLFSVVLPSEQTGSTTAARSASITATDGDEVVGAIRPVSGQTELSPPLRAGEFYAAFTHTGGAGGDNDFYVMKARLGPENPLEDGEPGNNGFGGAETLMMNDVDGAQRGFVTTSLPDGDIDYFGFDGIAGQTVEVHCSGESAGSGVRDLVVSVRDDADTVVVTGDETPQTEVALTGTLADTGSYAIRLSAGTPDSLVVSRFVRCGVTVRD